MQEYNKADQWLHHLCQVIAKANRTFVSEKADDSHTTLFFDALGDRITGNWTNLGKEPLLFTLRLDSFYFEVLTAGFEPVLSVASIGKSRDLVEEELENKLNKIGLITEGFRKKMQYQIPEYSKAGATVELLDSESFMSWKSYRNLANWSCYQLLGYARVRSGVNIWPHHFDTGIYAKLKNGLGLGFGLAMEDQITGAPYFYMAGYPKKGALSYEKAEDGDHWSWEVGEHWQGAILPLTKLHNASESRKKEMILEYLTEGFRAFMKLIR